MIWCAHRGQETASADGLCCRPLPQQAQGRQGRGRLPLLCWCRHRPPLNEAPGHRNNHGLLAGPNQRPTAMPTPSERQYEDALRRAEERRAAYRARHAQALASLGMVIRRGDRFRVRDITARTRRPAYTVWRHSKTRRVRCTCEDYKARRGEDPKYRCAHVLAVKAHLEAESARAAAAESAAPVVEISAKGTPPARETKPANRRRPRLPRDPDLLAVRSAWTDVADTLDRVAPRWSHRVMLVAKYGASRVKVVAAVTVNNVSRLGTGWGAPNAAGVRKAEDEALKKAATRFRAVALALMEAGGDDPHGGGAAGETAAGRLGKLRGRPEAKSQTTAATPKQLERIRRLERELGLEGDERAQLLFGCAAAALAKRFASVLLLHLEEELDELTYERHVAA